MIDLEAIRTRAEKATEGPWELRNDCVRSAPSQNLKDDLTFIAHARDDIPDLLAEVDRLREALRLAAIRLEILTDRMRSCIENGGKHELIDEAEDFCIQARAAFNPKD